MARTKPADPNEPSWITEYFKAQEDGDHKPGNDELLADAYEWLGDICDDLPVDIPAAEIVRNVNRWYDGGWDQFVRDTLASR